MGKLKLLITGASGLLGSNLAYYFKEKYQVSGTYLAHPVVLPGVDCIKADLSGFQETKELIERSEPDIVVHCAALANIDECEANPELAFKCNVSAVKNIVEALKIRPAKLIYISTDSVYDGEKGNFKETGLAAPRNSYGATKYEGELEVVRILSALVLRTNIFGWNVQDKASLGEWVLNSLEAGKRIRGFKDIYFSTIYTMEFARVLVAVMKKNLTGVYNLGAGDSLSKYEFAVRLAGRFGLDSALVEAVSFEDAPLKAARGRNLSLDTTKLKNAIGFPLPTVDESIESFYRDYKLGVQKIIRRKTL